MLQHVKFPPGL